MLQRQLLFLSPTTFGAHRKPEMLEIANKVGFECRDVNYMTRAEFFERIDNGEFDSVEAMTLDWRALVPGKWNDGKAIGWLDKEVIAKLPSSLKIIACQSSGVDYVDLEACSLRRIHVSNVLVPTPTADHTLWLMMSVCRNTYTAELNARNGTFNRNYEFLPAVDLDSCTVGILGFGSVGKEVAKKLTVFGSKVIYYSRTRLDEATEAVYAATYVSFQDLLKASDIISIHLPLTPKTNNMISTEEFKLMKRGVKIVNTSRGKVIDQSALLDAIDNGIVDSVGLDVFWNEPNVPEKLINNKKAILTTHIGGFTNTGLAQMEWTSFENALDSLKGVPPRNAVNKF